MDRMKRLTEAIRVLMEEEFSGYIKINFSQGSLGRIEKSEELEDAAHILVEEKKTRKKGVEAGIYKIATLALANALTLAALAGCASAGRPGLELPDNVAPESGRPESSRIVQPGDSADINYLCRLKTGELVASTKKPPEDQPKSGVFLPGEKSGPVSVTAGAPFPQLPGGQEMTFEDEIIYRLAGTVVGMREGEKLEVKLAAQEIPTRSERNYVVRLARVRTRPKELTIPEDEYREKTRKTPEVGQTFTLYPEFPGRVEAVRDREVVVRFAKRGDTVETPFGTGHIRDTGEDYKIEIDARKGALVRTGPLMGRISEVDEQAITVDYRNPFGGEALTCDVTVEKITGAKQAKSDTGE